MKKLRSFGLLVTVVLLAFGLALSCGSPAGPVEPPVEPPTTPGTTGPSVITIPGANVGGGNILGGGAPGSGSLPDFDVTPTSIGLVKGDTQRITVEGVTGATFESASTGVATVDNTGLVTAINEGTTYIKVTAQRNGEEKKVEVPVAVINLTRDPIQSMDWTQLAAYASQPELTDSMKDLLADAVKDKLEANPKQVINWLMWSGISGGFTDDFDLEADFGFSGSKTDELPLKVILGSTTKLAWNPAAGWDIDKPNQAVASGSKEYAYVASFAGTDVEFTYNVIPSARIDYTLKGVKFFEAINEELTTDEAVIQVTSFEADAPDFDPILAQDEGDYFIVKSSSSGDGVGKVTKIGVAEAAAEGKGGLKLTITGINPVTAPKPGTDDLTGFLVYDYHFASQNYTLTLEPTPVTAIEFSLDLSIGSPLAEMKVSKDNQAPITAVKKLVANGDTFSTADKLDLGLADISTIWKYGTTTKKINPASSESGNNFINDWYLEFPDLAPATDKAEFDITITVTPRPGYEFKSTTDVKILDGAKALNAAYKYTPSLPGNGDLVVTISKVALALDAGSGKLTPDDPPTGWTKPQTAVEVLSAVITGLTAPADGDDLSESTAAASVALTPSATKTVNAVTWTIDDGEGGVDPAGPVSEGDTVYAEFTIELTGADDTFAATFGDNVTCAGSESVDVELDGDKKIATVTVTFEVTGEVVEPLGEINEVTVSGFSKILTTNTTWTNTALTLDETATDAKVTVTAATWHTGEAGTGATPTGAQSAGTKISAKFTIAQGADDTAEGYLPLADAIDVNFDLEDLSTQSAKTVTSGSVDVIVVFEVEAPPDEIVTLTVNLAEAAVRGNAPGAAVSAINTAASESNVGTVVKTPTVVWSYAPTGGSATTVNSGAAIAVRPDSEQTYTSVVVTVEANSGFVFGTLGGGSPSLTVTTQYNGTGVTGSGNVESEIDSDGKLVITYKAITGPIFDEIRTITVNLAEAATTGTASGAAVDAVGTAASVSTPATVTDTPTVVWTYTPSGKSEVTLDNGDTIDSSNAPDSSQVYASVVVTVEPKATFEFGTLGGGSPSLIVTTQYNSTSVTGNSDVESTIDGDGKLVITYKSITGP